MMKIRYGKNLIPSPHAFAKPHAKRQEDKQP